MGKIDFKKLYAIVAAKILDALFNSCKGLQAVWKHQLAFRIVTFVFLLALPAALFVGKTAPQRALLIATLMLVLIIELVNSAIETTVDRIGLERHELSGRAKDIASAASFLAVINAGIVWTFVLFSE